MYENGFSERNHPDHNPPGGPHAMDVQAHRHFDSRSPKKRRGLMITLIVVGVVLVLCAGGAILMIAGLGKAANDVADGIAATQSAEAQAAEDRTASVKITRCAASEFGGVDIDYTVKNSTDTKQSYLIQFDIFAADGKTRLGEAHGAVNDLAPGATAKESTMGNVSGSLKGAKCMVTSA